MALFKGVALNYDIANNYPSTSLIGVKDNQLPMLYESLMRKYIIVLLLLLLFLLYYHHFYNMFVCCLAYLFVCCLACLFVCLLFCTG